MPSLPDTAPIFSGPQCHTPVRAGDTVCAFSFELPLSRPAVE